VNSKPSKTMAKKATKRVKAADALGVARGSHLMRVSDFEDACSADLNCDLWDPSLNHGYGGKITLAVSEMRYIANALRFMQGRRQRRYFGQSANSRDQPREGSG